MSNTSYGQQLTRRFLERIVNGGFMENYRPPWLSGLELDFYYPRFKVAFEFNGDQHYCPTRFGTPRAQKQRDAEKKRICRRLGVKLVSLMAIDLQSGTMNGKIKRAIGKHHMNQGYSTGDLDRLATAYRKQLIASYDSPTARRRRNAPFKAAMARAWGECDKPKIKEEYVRPAFDAVGDDEGSEMPPWD